MGLSVVVACFGPSCLTCVWGFIVYLLFLNAWKTLFGVNGVLLLTLLGAFVVLVVLLCGVLVVWCVVCWLWCVGCGVLVVFGFVGC